MEFAAFQNTRKHGDLSGNRRGYSYCGKQFEIADDDTSGGYHLAIENQQWIDHDLTKLERILWQWSLDGDYVLSGDSCFDLDRFIIGYCDSRGRAIDGDLFAILFSGPNPYTVAQASDLLESAFMHPLYLERA